MARKSLAAAVKKQVKTNAASLTADAVVKTLRSGKRSTPRTTGWLCENFSVAEGDILAVLGAMHESGYLVHLVGKDWHLDNAPIASLDPVHEYKSRKDGTYLFGAVGDCHLGSKYERLDVLNGLYDVFAEEGVDRVYHTGNWIDGEMRFNKHDLHVHGMDEQLQYLAEKYPRKDGIVTYAVAGDDHEGWYGQREGVDIGKRAEQSFRENGRSDWRHIGFMEAFVSLVHAKSKASSQLLVQHPGGGSAYALSYTTQKIVESLDGGEKPAVLLCGHYHKLWFGNIRNVWCVQTGCFTASTQIETLEGRKKISDIAVGDMVLTHKGRYRAVTNLFKRQHYGEFVRLNFGRKGRPDQTVTATTEHPVLVERNGERSWIAISDVVEGDVVFVVGKDCPVTGNRMPYWMNMSRDANPMDVPETRKKLSDTKGGFSKERAIDGAGLKHLEDAILPFCDVMQEQGWTMVPVGAGVIPDAIGFKDGEVVAFEVERSKGNLLSFKQSKYEGAAISEYIDRVHWEDISAERVEQPRSWYEADEETGFVKVKVLSATRVPVSGAHGRDNVSVYNFEVDEDNSYVAGHVVVHNCQQDQTPFMRKKRISAHVGGCLVRLTQDPVTGAIVRCRVEIMRYFNKGYYNGRWSHAGSVELPVRGFGLEDE